MRQFESGAKRDDADQKLEYGGFLSPLVLKAYAEYMNQHCTMKDGSRRGADNWKAGMPQRVYFECMLRHVMDVWLHMDGYGAQSREDCRDALCAVMFNAMGLLHERLKERV